MSDKKSIDSIPSKFLGYSINTVYIRGLTYGEKLDALSMLKSKGENIKLEDFYEIFKNCISNIDTLDLYYEDFLYLVGIISFITNNAKVKVNKNFICEQCKKEFSETIDKNKNFETDELKVDKIPAEIKIGGELYKIEPPRLRNIIGMDKKEIDGLESIASCLVFDDKDGKEKFIERMRNEKNHDIPDTLDKAIGDLLEFGQQWVNLTCPNGHRGYYKVYPEEVATEALSGSKRQSLRYEVVSSKNGDS